MLELLGAELVMVAALLAFWPRPAAAGPRLSVPGAVALLVSPRRRWSRSAARARCCSASALTLLTVCFLWLERLPLRPGLGVAALVGVALAGALPLAAAADRGEPWFDYQAFAEGLGPKDPVSFDWEHGDYGPIDVAAHGRRGDAGQGRAAAYWKVRTLTEFDGDGWDVGALRPRGEDPTLDLPRGLGDAARAARTTIQVTRAADARAPTWSARARRSTIADATRPDRARRGGPGSGSRSATCARATPTRAQVYVPRPTADQLAAVRAGADRPSSAEDAAVRVHLRELTRRPSCDGCRRACRRARSTARRRAAR